MATIRDVAKWAGVGLGTVSRVLNGSPHVREATRQRVLDAIEALNYSPNPIARRLSLGKTLTIAAVVPFFTRPSAVERLRGIESVIAESEYDLIVFNIETPERREACLRNLARRERVDGVLILSLPLDSAAILRFQRAQMPIVLIDVNHPSTPELSRVVVDDVAGGRMATQHLIDLGHQRIGFIGDPVNDAFPFTSSRDRYKGYRQALRAAGLKVRPEFERHGEHGRDTARELAAEMFTLDERPTAVFAASDMQALGVLEAAREAGLRVPEDLSVIGYDDIEIAKYLGLTTVRQLLFESGDCGVRLLLEYIEDPEKAPECHTLPSEVVVRRTTAPPAR